VGEDDGEKERRERIYGGFTRFWFWFWFWFWIVGSGSWVIYLRKTYKK